MSYLFVTLCSFPNILKHRRAAVISDNVSSSKRVHNGILCKNNLQQICNKLMLHLLRGTLAFASNNCLYTMMIVSSYLRKILVNTSTKFTIKPLKT